MKRFIRWLASGLFRRTRTPLELAVHDEGFDIHAVLAKRNARIGQLEEERDELWCALRAVVAHSRARDQSVENWECLFDRAEQVLGPGWRERRAPSEKSGGGK